MIDITKGACKREYQEISATRSAMHSPNGTPTKRLTKMERAADNALRATPSGRFTVTT